MTPNLPAVRSLIAGLIVVAIPTLASASTVIVDFGATSGTVTAAANVAGTQTTIAATDLPVSVDTFFGVAASLNGFLTLNATSTGTAVDVTGTDIQHYSGTFEIYSATGMGGSNYLSGTFTDAVTGADGGSHLGLQFSQPPDSVIFTSDFGTTFSNPLDGGFTFTGVTPSVGITGSTLSSFTAAVAGDFSAASLTATPEPASMLLLGTGLVGLGAAARRRRKA